MFKKFARPVCARLNLTPVLVSAEGVRRHAQAAVRPAAVQAPSRRVRAARARRDEERQEVFVRGVRQLRVRRESTVVEQRTLSAVAYLLVEPLVEARGPVGSFNAMTELT